MKTPTDNRLDASAAKLKEAMGAVKARVDRLPEGTDVVLWWKEGTEPSGTAKDKILQSHPDWELIGRHDPFVDRTQTRVLKYRVTMCRFSGPRNPGHWERGYFISNPDEPR